VILLGERSKRKDVLSRSPLTPFSGARFDLIASIATLHHLPLQQAFLRMKDVLRPNGTLLIHDLVADDGIMDRVRSMFASVN
jgi:SAM-dependent methyltransferase